MRPQRSKDFRNLAEKPDIKPPTPTPPKPEHPIPAPPKPEPPKPAPPTPEHPIASKPPVATKPIAPTPPSTPSASPVDATLYEMNSNGGFITPQMARAVREFAPLAMEVRVCQSQMNKIVTLYQGGETADVTIDKSGLIFAGLHLTMQADLLTDQMGFYDASGNLVAKIIGLER